MLPKVLGRWTILLLPLLCIGCSKDNPTTCFSIPPPPLPELAADSASLHWLNGIHAGYEASVYDSLSPRQVDSLLWVGRQLSHLNLSDTLALYRARADRLYAYDLQVKGQYPASLPVLQASVERLEARPLKHPTYYYELAYHYNLAGIAAERTYDWNLALLYMHKSLKINEAHGYHKDAAIELINLGDLYGALGRDREAIQALDRATVLAKATEACLTTDNDRTLIPFAFYVRALNRAGIVRQLIYEGDSARAVELADSVRDDIVLVRNKIEEYDLSRPEVYLRSLDELQSEMLLEASALRPRWSAEGREATERLLATAPADDARIPLYRAWHLLWSVRYEDACISSEDTAYLALRRYLDTNQVARWASFDEELQIRLRVPSLLARAAAHCGWSGAETLALEAVGDYARALELIGSEFSREAQAGDQYGRYSDAAEVIRRRGARQEWSEELFTLAEHSKNFALRTALARSNRRQEATPEYRRLYQKRDSLVALLNRARDLGDVDEILRATEALSNFYAGLARRNTTPGRHLLRDPRSDRPVSSPDLQDDLPPGTAYVDIFRGRGRYIVAGITGADRRQFEVSATAELAEALRAVGGAEGYRLASRAPGARVVRQLLGPLLSWLDGLGYPISNLIISRDPALGNVFFDQMPLPKASGTLLFERYATAYAYGTVARTAARRAREVRPAAAVGWGGYLATSGTHGGQPLPHMEAELHRVARRYFDGGNLYPQITVDAFRRTTSEHRYLALAAHGRQTTADPLVASPYIQVAPSAADDGRLTIYDIYDLELNTDLIMILSCQGGRGLYQNAEGAKSLARAFLYAGSSAVIAGNGLIRDAHAAEITRLFYQYWIGEQQPAAWALQMAKTAFRRNSPQVDPAMYANLYYFGLPEIYFSK